MPAKIFRPVLLPSNVWGRGTKLCQAQSAVRCPLRFLNARGHTGVSEGVLAGSTPVLKWISSWRRWSSTRLLCKANPSEIQWVFMEVYCKRRNKDILAKLGKHGGLQIRMQLFFADGVVESANFWSRSSSFENTFAIALALIVSEE